MFDMFRGGKPDPMTLMAVDYEESRSKRAREILYALDYIAENYIPGDTVDADEVAQDLGISPFTANELIYLQRELNHRA